MGAVKATSSHSDPEQSTFGVAAACKNRGPDRRPKVHLDFAGKIILSLGDCGSDVCAVSKSVFDSLPTAAILETFPVPVELRKVRAADSHAMDSICIAVLRFAIANLGVRSWPFIVFRELSSSAILGDDFMRAHGARLDRATGEIAWRAARASHVLRVLSNAFWIPPRAAARVCTTSRDDERLRGLGIVSSAAIACIEGVQEADAAGNVALVVYNDSDEILSFRKGQEIAEFQPIQRTDVVSEKNLLTGLQKPARVTPLSPQKRDFICKEAKLHCPPELRDQYLNILCTYHDAIAENAMDLGRCGAVKHDVRMRTDEPIHHKQYRIPMAHRAFVHEQVDGLLKKGVIEPSMSPYNSPVFCVKKPHSDKLRLVQDLRAINDNAYDDKYAFREVADCVDQIGRAQSNVFSSLDFLSGYWQQELTERCRPVTAFTVPGRGRFQWTRTVMGLAGSPSSFSRLMEEVFRPVTETVTYLDDCLVHTNGHAAQLVALRRCLQQCILFNLKLNLSKCLFGAHEVTYLGFRFSGNGVRPGEEKLAAVRDFPEPTSVRQIRQFTGLANYFRAMIPNYANLSGHLTSLTRKNAQWIGGKLPPAAKDAFEKLKMLLCRKPVMAYPRRDSPFFLSTDACSATDDHAGGYGAVLSQVQDGRERVVAYASRSLQTHEKNYSAFLLEMGAAAWAIDHFHVYLHGHRFTLLMDHRPLETLRTIHKKTLNRLQHQMSLYNFELRYRPGSYNGPADALSRNVAPSVAALALDVDRMRAMQQEDGLARAVRKRVEDDQFSPLAVARISSKCVLDNGLVWYQVDNGKKLLYSPLSLRHELMTAAHASRFAGHGGVDKTLARLRSLYWWPGMTVDVKKFVRECQLCQEAKTPKRHSVREPLCPLPCPTAPNWRVHLDLFGPLALSADGNRYILVCTDAFSKLTELVALPNKEAGTVALAFFNRWVCRYSAPRTIVSDGGKEFVNKLNEDFLKLLEVEHVITSAYHPQTNSSAESFNREIIRYLSVMMPHADADWEALLPVLMLSYNTRVHRATQQSPFFLTYLHEPNLPYFELENGRVLYGEDWATEAAQRMKHAYDLTRRNLTSAASANKRAYDRSARPGNGFVDGEYCMVYFPKTVFNKENLKFVRPWIKHKVLKRISPTTYLVLRESGTSRATPSVVHSNRMKKYFPASVSAPDITTPVFENQTPTNEEEKLWVEFDLPDAPRVRSSVRRRRPPLADAANATAGADLDSTLEPTVQRDASSSSGSGVHDAADGGSLRASVVPSPPPAQPAAQSPSASASGPSAGPASSGDASDRDDNVDVRAAEDEVHSPPVRGQDEVRRRESPLDRLARAVFTPLARTRSQRPQLEGQGFAIPKRPIEYKTYVRRK